MPEGAKQRAEIDSKLRTVLSNIELEDVLRRVDVDIELDPFPTTSSRWRKVLHLATSQGFYADLKGVLHASSLSL